MRRRTTFTVTDRRTGHTPFLRPDLAQLNWEVHIPQSILLYMTGMEATPLCTSWTSLTLLWFTIFAVVFSLFNGLPNHIANPTMSIPHRAKYGQWCPWLIFPTVLLLEPRTHCSLSTLTIWLISKQLYVRYYANNTQAHCFLSAAYISGLTASLEKKKWRTTDKKWDEAEQKHLKEITTGSVLERAFLRMSSFSNTSRFDAEYTGKQNGQRHQDIDSV